jgi:sulfur-oxidizing protein SoxY
MPTTRRQIIAAGLGVGAAVLVRPASATTEEMDAAVRSFTGGAPVREGKVRFEIAPLVENGNTVPISIGVDNPMTAADHVQAIVVFNERNPQTQVANFVLGPRAGRATVSTRIRLATSQKLIAVARMNDGSHWSRTVDVIVTLAACVES